MINMTLILMSRAIIKLKKIQLLQIVKETNEMKKYYYLKLINILKEENVLIPLE